MKQCYLKGMFDHETVLFKGVVWPWNIYWQGFATMNNTYLAMQHDGETREIWKIMPELCCFLQWTLVVWPKHEIQALNIDFFLYQQIEFIYRTLGFNLIQPLKNATR